MSYRYHLSIVDNDVLNSLPNVEQKLTNIDIDEIPTIAEILSTKDVLLIPHLTPEYNELYDAVNSNSAPLFSGKMAELYAEGNVRICTKDTLLCMIEAMRKLVKQKYQNLFVDKDKCQFFAYERSKQWSKISEILDMKLSPEADIAKLPYNMTDDNSLVNSWDLEYAIFEIVFLAKTFNWFGPQKIIWLGW